MCDNQVILKCADSVLIAILVTSAFWITIFGLWLIFGYLQICNRATNIACCCGCDCCCKSKKLISNLKELVLHKDNNVGDQTAITLSTSNNEYNAVQTETKVTENTVNEQEQLARDLSLNGSSIYLPETTTIAFESKPQGDISSNNISKVLDIIYENNEFEDINHKPTISTTVDPYLKEDNNASIKHEINSQIVAPKYVPATENSITTIVVDTNISKKNENEHVDDTSSESSNSNSQHSKYNDNFADDNYDFKQESVGNGLNNYSTSCNDSGSSINENAKTMTSAITRVKSYYDDYDQERLVDEIVYGPLSPNDIKQSSIAKNYKSPNRTDSNAFPFPAIPFATESHNTSTKTITGSKTKLEQIKLKGVTTSNTSISQVSSVGDAYEMNDIVVVMLGIGKYDDGLHDLAGVEKDYNNVINTFVKYWNYKVLYKIDDNDNDSKDDNHNDSLIYTNDRNTIDKNKNYKLYWTSEDIELFVEQARKTLVKNKHDGLIFVISSHGDTDKVIYDSKCDEFKLESLFSMFAPQWSVLLETYNETAVESNRLFKIPKIFCIDSCRGNLSAKLTNVNHKNDDSGDIQNHAQNNTEDKVQKCVANTDHVNNNTVGEHYKLKTISKQQAKQHFASMSNFCKLWANINGYSVADGSINGGLFLRNVCKLFKDTNYIKHHGWTDIILKIREYTKRQASLIGIFNFTQLVESEDTLEYPIKFKRQKCYNKEAIPKTNAIAIPSLADSELKAKYEMTKLLRAIKSQEYEIELDLGNGLGKIDIVIPPSNTDNTGNIKNLRKQRRQHKEAKAAATKQGNLVRNDTKHTINTYPQIIECGNRSMTGMTGVTFGPLLSNDIESQLVGFRQGSTTTINENEDPDECDFGGGLSRSNGGGSHSNL